MKSEELIVTKRIDGELVTLPISEMKDLEKKISLGIKPTEQERKEKVKRVIEHMDKLVKEFNLKN